MKRVIYNGIEYSSIRELARAFNKNPVTVTLRYQRTKDIDLAMTYTERLRQSYKDHLGNFYPNLKKLCVHYKMTVNAFRYRQKKGWSLRKILTTPLNHKNTAQKITLNGVEYKSLRQACKAKGISVDKYNYYKTLGKNLLAEEDK